jgi:DNA-binding beta-propeller fold protein YncE
MMRRIIGRVVCVVVACGFAASAFAGIEPGLYGLQSWGDNGVYKIDESTGEATLISTLPYNTFCVGISFMNGVLYASDIDPVNPDILHYGWIDVPTGEYTGIHNQDGNLNWHGLASSDALGLTWAIDQAGMWLKSTDADGVITVIGHAGIDGRGMAYDDTHGILYATDWGGGLYTLDISTAAATFIGNMGVNVDMAGLAYDEVTQTLYLNDFWGGEGNLYTVDVDTAEITLVGPNGYDMIDGLAWIPEPASLSLLAIGGLFLLRRR